VRDEKLLEHWIASKMLDLMAYKNGDIYVDVAAANSPWTQKLRERQDIAAYAIDLCAVGKDYQHLPYYRIENATKTTFADASVTGASLQCAYEMFMHEDDTNFIHEVARILKPGGKVVILPLYMHTHHCAYATPEHFGKGYQDAGAKEYVRFDCDGVPSSRKYNAQQLKLRVLDPIVATGMRYRLHALRNKTEFGNNIYCHFILEIEK
jgi:ubiquinone/menaquinone biosynthesis C-methylase UbiE